MEPSETALVLLQKGYCLRSIQLQGVGEKMGDGLGGGLGCKKWGRGCLGMGLAVGLGLDGSEMFS